MNRNDRHNYITMQHAVGTIEAGPTQQERLSELTDRLHGSEFYVDVRSSIPSKCIDGRIGANGYAPNAAGGTETIMVADDLTFKRFATDGSTAGAYRTTLEFLIDQGLPVGGHTDAHASGEKSGCGANDRLAEIYAFIAQHGETLQALAGSFGVQISNATRNRIVTNASARQEFSNGSALLEELREKAGEAAIDPLVGDHQEVVAVINTVAGTTLDRDALQVEFGAEYEAFNVDVWAFTDAAEAIAADEKEVRELVAAMVLYNLATAHVLCGPNMRVIVRSAPTE